MNGRLGCVLCEVSGMERRWGLNSCEWCGKFMVLSIDSNIQILRAKRLLPRGMVGKEDIINLHQNCFAMF